MKHTILTIALIFSLIGSIAYIFQIRGEKKALEKSKSIIEEKLETEKEKNFIEIDSLEKVSESQEPIIEKAVNDNQIIDNQISENRKTQTQDEKAINHINNTDSLQQLFTRFYPDNKASSSGSD